MTQFNPLDEASKQFAKAGARQNIVNVIRSYHNGTDVLAEPVQNAVDEVEAAVREGVIAHGEVRVRIDHTQNEITVWDNGRGMTRDFAQAALAPDVTMKAELFKEGLSRGHKGVGMTFLAYGFDEFELQSRTGDDYFRITMSEARTWVNGDGTADFPLATIDDLAEGEGELHSTGLMVRIRVSPITTPRSLSHSFPTIRAARTALLSGTAIGVLRLGDSPSPVTFDASLEFTSKQASMKVEKLSPGYLYPHLELPKQVKVRDITGDRHDPSKTAPSPSDQQAYYAAHTTFSTQELVQLMDGASAETLQTSAEVAEFLVEHKVAAYALASVGADFQDTLLESWGVSNWKKRLGAGLRVGTDGMVSSWSRPLNLTHRGFNVNRIWLVFDFSDVEPDLGRKDFPPPVREIIELLENPLADKIDTLARAYLRPRSDSGKPFDTQPPEGKAAEHLKKPFPKRDLGALGRLGIQTLPVEEQDVVALFHELRGLGVLRHFEMIFSSSSYAYDAYVEYLPDWRLEEVEETFPADEPGAYDLVGALEFKLDGKSLLADLVNGSKRWGHLRFLVCWTISSNSTNIGGNSLTFESVDTSSYSCVTHEAKYSGNNESVVYVIELESLVDRLTQ